MSNLARLKFPLRESTLADSLAKRSFFSNDKIHCHTEGVARSISKDNRDISLPLNRQHFRHCEQVARLAWQSTNKINLALSSLRDYLGFSKPK